MSDLVTINVRGVEKWREYDFADRCYRIMCPCTVQYRPGGATHRVTGEDGIVHVVPAPGVNGCVMRFFGEVIA